MREFLFHFELDGASLGREASVQTIYYSKMLKKLKNNIIHDLTDSAKFLSRFNRVNIKVTQEQKLTPPKPQK